MTKNLKLLMILGVVLLAGCRATEERYLARGKRLVEKKEYARAILEFRNAVKLNPKSAESYYQAGLAYLAMGDFRMGYGSLQRATELNPNHKAAQLKLAEVIESSIPVTKSQQSVADAEQRVQSILAIVPDSPEALGALGMAEYMLGKPEDAVKHLQTALEKAPQHLQAATALAIIRLKQKDFAGAEQIMKKAADDSPKSAEAQTALGTFYAANRRPSEAEAAYRRALAVNPKYAPALLDLARVQIGAGHKDDAEKTLAALSALPDRQYRPIHAAFLFEQGKRDEALKEFEQQFRADPNDRDAFRRLTSAYFFTKRFPDAENAINAALKKNPKNNYALIERSKLYLMTAKFKEAEADLTQALKLEPNSATAHYLLSKVYQAEGRQLAARQELSRALDFDPNLLAARIELAQSLTAQKDTKAALDLLNDAPENQKKALPVIVAKNWALFNGGQEAELRKSIADGLAAYGRAPDLVLQDGLLKFQAKDMTGARKSLEEVLAARPEDTLALDTLGRTYVLQKQPEIGLRTVVQYAARVPNSAPVQDLLGNWMSHSNHRDEARKAYKAALAADSGLVSARMMLAVLDASEGKFDSARQRLTQVASTTPVPADRARAEIMLGQLEEKAGNPAAGIPHYRKALEAEPNNAEALNNLAYLLANGTDQIDEALRYAQQAKELDPNSVAVEDTIGWAFYRKGLYDSAVSHLQNAVAKGPSAVLKYHLAMAYLKAGDRQRGQRTLEEARRLDPNIPEAAAATQLVASLGFSK